MKKRGFTLIELLISIIIGILLLATVYYVLGRALRQWQRVNKQTENLQIINMVRERISREARGSWGVLPSSTPTQLKLNYGKDVVSYDLANQKVRRIKNSSVAYLTDVGKIKSLSFGYPADKVVEINLEELRNQILIRN